MKLEVGARGGPRIAEVVRQGDGLIVRLDGRAVPVRWSRVAGAECWRLQVDGTVVPVRVRPADGGVAVIIDDTRVHLTIRRALPIPSRRAVASESTDRIEVRAPMPGLVVALPRHAGEPVAAGDTVAVVEAMKMQIDVPSPARGRLEDVRATPGQEVGGGQVLAVIQTGDRTPRPEAE
jgi:acetyl/propionyl-CoA carboxylase alpha subunit